MAYSNRSFGSASLDKPSNLDNGRPTSARRSISAAAAGDVAIAVIVDQFLGIRRKAHRRLNFAAGAARQGPKYGASSGERESRIDNSLHLLCVALVAVVTIGVFFGIGLYLLGHSHRDLSGVHSPEVVADGEGGASHAEVPAAVAASLRTLTTMAPSTGSASPMIPAGAAGPPPVPTAQPGAPAQNLGVLPTQSREPIDARAGQQPEPKRFAMASTEIVSGVVTQVSDAMTWVVGNNTVHLWGIRPAAQGQLPSLEKLADWARANGPVECRKQPHSSRYRCSTSAGEDIAEAALLAGVAHAAGGATPAYRKAEAQAHRLAKTP